MRLAPFTAAALFMPLAVQAQIYRCPDAGGRTVIQQLPCAGGQTLDVRPATGSGRESHDETVPYTSRVMSDADASEQGRADVRAVRATLKDPASAKFSHTRTTRFRVTGHDHALTCGLVNARNSFGGFVGDQPFLVFDGDPVIRSGVRDDVTYQIQAQKVETALHACTARGMSFSP